MFLPCFFGWRREDWIPLLWMLSILCTNFISRRIAGLNVTSWRLCWCSKTKGFSPLGTRLYFRYFHVNACWKNYIVLTPKVPWPPCTWMQTQEIDLYCRTPYIILKFSYLLFTSVGTWSWLKKMTLYLLRLKSIVIMYSFKNSNLVLVKQNHEPIFLKLSC